MTYVEISVKDAYRLVNPGPLVLIATKGQYYDITPIAWNCPVDYDPVTKLLFVSDPTHQAAINVKKKKKFAVCVPHVSQVSLVTNCGSVSDASVDKISRFSINCLSAKHIDVKIPAGCIGWIECSLKRVISEGSVEIFIGEAIGAYVLSTAWNGSLNIAVPEGCPIHHIGDGFASLKKI